MNGFVQLKAAHARSKDAMHAQSHLQAWSTLRHLTKSLGHKGVSEIPS